MAKKEQMKGKKKPKKKFKIDPEILGLCPECYDCPPDFPEIDPPDIKLMERPVISRAEWGADPPKETTTLEFPVRRVLFTYTDTEECTTKEQCSDIVKRLQVQHMNERGMADIQYNFLAGGDLNVYEGRGWTAKPDKNERFPKLIKKSVIEIAYIGMFKERTPPHEMQKQPWNMLEDAIGEDRLYWHAKITDDFYDPHYGEDIEDYFKNKDHTVMPSDN